MLPHPTSWRSNLILSSHLHLGLPSGLFPSGFPTQTLYAPLFSPIHATCPNHLILLDLIIQIIFSEGCKSVSSSLCSFLHSRHLILPTSKYSPLHQIFKHPQPTFFPQCEQPSFTSIQINRQNYSSVYLNLYIVREQTGRQKILHRMTAGIRWLQSNLNFFLIGILIC